VLAAAGLAPAAEALIRWQDEESMLSQQEILEAWQKGKSERPFQRLASESEAAFEYRGSHFGHPSNYAAIRILATPSMDFNLASAVIYPPSVSPDYARQLLFAISCAAVDELFSATWYPYRGCSLLVREVGWDEIMSSEVAVYRAARGALSELRRVGTWDMTT
jgi:hypothetical protein